MAVTEKAAASALVAASVSASVAQRNPPSSNFMSQLGVPGRPLARTFRAEEVAAGRTSATPEPGAGSHSWQLQATHGTGRLRVQVSGYSLCPIGGAFPNVMNDTGAWGTYSLGIKNVELYTAGNNPRKHNCLPNTGATVDDQVRRASPCREGCR